MYIVGADGTPYGFTNDHGPEDITRFMDACLARFRAHPPKPVIVTEAEKRAPFAIAPPATASVLNVYSRIPSPPNTCSLLNRGIGRDFCWVYGDEIAALNRAVAAGNTSPFPLLSSLARRIARFHLVDDVRGTPNMWEASDLHHAAWSARSVRQSGNVRTIAFAGPFAMHNASGRRGYEGAIEGEMDVDAAAQQVTRFRAFADGKAWGAGTYTPNQPPGRYRLVTAFHEATDPIARIVPPEEVATFNRDTRYRRP